MKKQVFFYALILLFSSLVFSQEYVVNDNFYYATPGVSTQITTLTGGDWDNGYYDLALPASNQFYFYGKKVTHLRISTNGYVVMGFGSASGDGTDFSNDPIPNPGSPNAIVAPWWTDWNLTSAGQMWYVVATGGPGGYNWVTIEWKSVAHVDDPSSSIYSFEVVFFAEYYGSDIQAGAGSILFNYLETGIGTGTHDYGKTGTVGVEHYTGLQGEQYSYNTASLNNNRQILFTPFVPVYGSTNFWNGYGTHADLGVFRPSTGYWYGMQNPYEGSETGYMQWGQNLDIPVPGDYDGDGAADVCLYRPSNGVWYCPEPSFAIQWGTVGDIPVPADYDGDTKMDLAVFRPREGTWYILKSSGGTSAISWGTQGDIPLAGDVDGDSKADQVVWRPSNGYFYALKSTGGSLAVQWGSWEEGDIPLLGHWSGAAGTGEPAVFRPSNGTWYVNDWTGVVAAPWQWGQAGDIPMPVDWLATGYTWFMVFRPNEGNWYQYQAGTSNVYNWGTLGDKPRCKRENLLTVFVDGGNPAAAPLIR